MSFLNSYENLFTDHVISMETLSTLDKFNEEITNEFAVYVLHRITFNYNMNIKFIQNNKTIRYHMIRLNIIQFILYNDIKT